MPAEPLTIVLVLLIVSVAAAVQGAIGIGLGLLAAPFLALLAPGFIPGPMLASVFFLTLLLLMRERRSIDLHGVGWALLGRLPGTALGAMTVALLPANAIDVALGSMLLLCVGLSASRWSLQPSRHSLFGAGVLSGTTGTAAGVGGPPIALIYQHAPGERLRSTMAGYFVVGTGISIATLSLVGRFGRAELIMTVTMLPAIVVGFLISTRIRSFVDRGHTREAVLALSGLAALFVLVRGLLGLSGWA